MASLARLAVEKGLIAMTGAAIDRVHFLDEQRRNRRRSLRFFEAEFKPA